MVAAAVAIYSFGVQPSAYEAAKEAQITVASSEIPTRSLTGSSQGTPVLALAARTHDNPDNLDCLAPPLKFLKVFLSWH